MSTPAKEWTIVVLSENQARMRQFHLKRHWFFAAVTVGIAAVALLLIFGYKTWSLSSQIQDNTALRAKVEELEATNDRIRDIAERLGELKQFEQQLRRGLLMPEEGLPSDEALAADPNILAATAEQPSEESDLLGIYTERQVDYSAEAVLPSDIPTYPPVRGYVTRSFESKHDLTDPGHYGLDVAAKVGTPVLASANGLVLFAGWSYPYGNLVVIAHKSGFDSFYGHNQVLLVKPGERVLQGQPIALLGNSGRSSAPHLHFEIWKDGARVDPETVLSHEAG
jgi:murein DD-endopeptidase MepM/ murein hydrolase activator NlpD